MIDCQVNQGLAIVLVVVVINKISESEWAYDFDDRREIYDKIVAKYSTI